MSRAAPAFERKEIALPAGARRVHDDGEWRGALVVIERGEIEIECASGARHHFRRGDMLWLADLGLCAIRNPGACSALLVAIRRRDNGAPPAKEIVVARARHHRAHPSRNP